MTEELEKPTFSEKLDAAIEAMRRMPPGDFPVTHYQTPGMYCREIFMPKGSRIISAKHKTEHPFVISQGIVHVFSENEGPVVYVAPYTGITKPGTQRLLVIEEDTIWTTFHATTETDIDKICETLVERDERPGANQYRLQNPAAFIE